MRLFLYNNYRDIGKLFDSAKDGEAKYNDQQAHLKSQQMNPNIAATTMNPHSVMFLMGIPAPPRCTIPLAMTCLSAMELMGALLIGYDSQFMERVKYSFEYGGFPQDHATRDALRGLFRNGFMHCFLPQGISSGVRYDSSYDQNTNLFVEESGIIVLNVNYLASITLGTASKLFHDQNIIPSISINLENMLDIQLREATPLTTAVWTRMA